MRGCHDCSQTGQASPDGLPAPDAPLCWAEGVTAEDDDAVREGLRGVEFWGLGGVAGGAGTLINVPVFGS